MHLRSHILVGFQLSKRQPEQCTIPRHMYQADEMGDEHLPVPGGNATPYLRKQFKQGLQHFHVVEYEQVQRHLILLC